MSTLSIVDNPSVVKGMMAISSEMVKPWTGCANLNPGGGVLSTLGSRILRALERAGLTRHELAATLRLSYSAVCKYTEDRRRPNPEVLREIADACQVSVDYLLGRTDTRNPVVRESHPDYDPELEEALIALRNDGELLPEDHDELVKFIRWLKHRKESKKDQG